MHKPTRKSGIKKRPLPLRKRLERDKEILRNLLSAKKIGLELLSMEGRPDEPLAVYGYLPFPILFQSNGQRMPRWDELTSWMKVQLCVLAFSEWKRSLLTFTVHLHTKKVDKWLAKKQDVKTVFRDRLRRELDREVGNGREFLFAVEGLSKRGRTRTFLHAHGGVMMMDASEQETIQRSIGRAAAQGIKGYPKEPRAVSFKPFWGGDERWGNYILKFVNIKDERLAERRLAMSQSAIAAGREFWNLISGRWKGANLRHLMAEQGMLED